MSDSPAITATMTVREVMTRYPAAVEVFNKHGLTGCGGPQGPLEPIAFFATVHHVDPQLLLQELNALVSTEPHMIASPPQSAEQPDIYKVFLKTAIVIALTAGCTLGAITLVAMALSGSVASVWGAITQAHGHAQIFGWVGLFIMGIAYHVLPRLKATQLQGRPLALASYGFVLGGIVLRTLAQPFAMNPLLADVVIFSATLELIGASLFLYVVVRTLASSPQPVDVYEKYILASVAWFWALATATLALALYSAAYGLDIVPSNLDAPYLHMGLMGFAGMMIFGITLRTIPVFMGLRTPDKGAFDAIFWALNLGIALRVASGFLHASYGSITTYIAAAGAALEYIAILGFVYSLSLFRKPVMNIAEAGAERGYEKFIRAAYAWLLVAASMTTAYALYQVATGQEVAHSLVGAYRHTLTVGFISMMILGMASRIIPVFTGGRLNSPTLLLGSFVLINLGNALRVTSQPLADLFGGILFPIMGASGVLEVVALALFGYNIWKTMDHPVGIEEGSVSPEAGVITKDMIVGDVLERYPQALRVFLQHGFVQLKNPLALRTLAKAITIAQACRIHPADLDTLLADLNSLRAPLKLAEQGDGIVDHAAFTRESTVGQVLERYPAALEVFLGHGLLHLRDEALRKAVANAVTIEMACRVHSLDAEQLLAELNAPGTTDSPTANTKQ